MSNGMEKTSTGCRSRHVIWYDTLHCIFAFRNRQSLPDGSNFDTGPVYRFTRWNWFALGCLFRQQRTNVPSKHSQLLLLLFAEGTELLGVNIDPCGQSLKAVIVQVDALMPVRMPQKIKKLTVHGRGLAHYRSVSFEGEFLKIFFSK